MSPATSTVIRDATILSMDDDIGDLTDGDVLIGDGRVVAVGHDLDAPPDAVTVDGRGRIVVPGFVDTHRHMFQAALRGMAPHHTLSDYFTHILGRVAPLLSPEELRIGELLGARGALRSGVTTVQDISNIQSSPAHTDALVDGLQSSGLRAVFAYGLSFADVASGTRLPSHEVRRLRKTVLADDTARVTMAVVAEASSDEVERANAALARDLHVRVARHVSREYPVGRLESLGALVPGTTFIHANGLPDDDFRVIAEHGGSVSVAPAIEMMMGHGYPVLGDLPDDVLATLSTDVEVTVPADMFTQMRAAFASARTRELVPGGARRSVTVRDILRAATRDGAESLGLGERTGTITPGKAADLLVLRADGVDVAPVIDPVSTAVLQLDRSHVETVFLDGTRVVIPDDDLVDRAAATVRRLDREGALTR